MPHSVTPAISGSPLIGVLALQGDVREHVRAVHAAGARATSVRRPDELESVDGLIIPGGESTTLWRLATSFDMMEPLRKMLGAGLPAFGSCAGMIMLADRLVDGVAGQQTFGGIDMTVRRNAFGRQVDSASRIAGEAVDQAQKTDARISQLSRAAARIGDVVNLIKTIAELPALLL